MFSAYVAMWSRRKSVHFCVFLYMRMIINISTDNLNKWFHCLDSWMLNGWFTY
jgi:hypothetical protein